MTTVAGSAAAYCGASPKSCFGSCPTLYVGDDERPVAEGFSSSIARALEARDVDALFGARSSRIVEHGFRRAAGSVDVA